MRYHPVGFTLVQGLFLFGTIHAFSPCLRQLARPARATHNLGSHVILPQLQHSSTSLFLSAEGEAPKRRRKRVKRKEPTVSAEEAGEEAPEVSAAETAVPELKPREDGPVKLQVQDVRSLVGGGAASSGGNPPSSSSPSFVASSSGNTVPSASSGDSSSLSDDSLRMLLEDAKELQALEGKQSGSVTSSDEESTEFSIPDTVRSVLSTIVTVDFFVVCGFLLWFLAGIFCSYVLKDDTVQIAFNQLFQPIVQPALGILMIAAIAGSFAGKDEEE